MNSFTQSRMILSNIKDNTKLAFEAIDRGDVQGLRSLAFETASMEIEFEVMTRPLSVDWLRMN